ARDCFLQGLVSVQTSPTDLQVFDTCAKLREGTGHNAARGKIKARRLSCFYPIEVFRSHTDFELDESCIPNPKLEISYSTGTSHAQASVRQKRHKRITSFVPFFLPSVLR